VNSPRVLFLVPVLFAAPRSRPALLIVIAVTC
jgi:hypothetical protein